MIACAEALSIVENNPGRNARFETLYKNTIEHFVNHPHVVVGCGSIGGYVIKALGQIGIKNLTLWDHDTIEVVNIGPQGFYPISIGNSKVFEREQEFLAFAPDSICRANNSRFQKKADHPKEAYWWLCVDSLSSRETIFKTALKYEPHKIIDTRMSGLNYEIYNANSGTVEEYFATIQFARDNPVEEGCTSRSTPHCAMIAASIGINLALAEQSPFAVTGNMMDYHQEIKW